MDVLLELLDDSDNEVVLYAIHSTWPVDYYIPLLSHTFSEIWIMSGNCTSRRGLRHSFDDQPAEILHYNHNEWRKRWYKNGLFHRDNDLPAVISHNGDSMWYQYGKFHRDNDQPAAIFADGTKKWFQNDFLHRDNDQPAVIWNDFYKCWYKNGKRYLIFDYYF